MPSGIRLLVGLGNPGPRYQWTRHNVGFEVVDGIARAAGTRFKRNGESRLVAEARFEGRSIVLAKPLTYMNLSGQPVVDLATARGVAPDEILVFVDDVALPLGALRIRERGGDGGHRGLASVIEALGENHVPRVRLGIRPEEEPADLAQFVLEPFTSDERPIVDRLIERAVDATRTLFREGVAKAMSVYNRNLGGTMESAPTE